MKLSAAVRRFDTQMRADGKSPHTQQVYLRDLRFLAQWLRRDVDISTITPDRLARYLVSNAFTQTPAGKPKAPISINRSKSALRSFFRFLTDSGFLQNNPARLVRSTRVSQKPPRCLTGGEVRALLQTIRGDDSPTARRDLVMFTLLAGTGMRLGSLVNLNVGDVDLAAGTVRVNGKGNVEQLVYLSPRLRKLLKRHRNGGTYPDGPLFVTVRGRRIGPRQVQLRLAHWLTRSGIEGRASVHTLRHTFATLLYQATGDLRLVQSALGHRRLSTTEIYTRLAQSQFQRAVRALGEQLR